MELTRCEGQVFRSQTVSLDKLSFVRCQFIGCHMIIGNEPHRMEGCRFDQCTWSINRILRPEDEEFQDEIFSLLNVIRMSRGKPTIAAEILAESQKTVNRFATHLPVLMACVAHTTGPVLELGCGNYSTPILNCMCKGRKVVSVESNAEWLSRFSDLTSPHHAFIHADWENLRLPDREWDVALIDHDPIRYRVRDIGRLMDKARFLVVHDTESPTYGYEPLISRFKYRYDYKRLEPWTTVLSQTTPVDFLA